MRRSFSLRSLLRQVAALILVLHTLAPALHAVPGEMNYQGKLTSPAGNPLTGPQTIVVEVFDDPTAGTLLFGPESHSVTATNGVFSLRIGALSAPSALSSALQGAGTRWLRLTVNGTVMSPRQQLLSTPYALSVAAGSVGTTELADNAVTSAKILDGTIVNADVSASANIAANKIAAGNFQNAAYTFPSGLNLSGASGGAANAIGFGGGANQTLTATAVAELVGGAATTLHTHTGLMPAPHASTHAPGAGDTIDGSYLALANPQTVTGVKTFNPSSGIVPFAVDATKTGEVANLNANRLQGNLASAFVSTGTVQSITGTKTFNSNIVMGPANTVDGYDISLSGADWDTAFNERLRWDGGATGLTAATGRTSLGLGGLATLGAVTGGAGGTITDNTVDANDVAD